MNAPLLKKVFTKEEWLKLLQRELIKAPEHDGEHIYEYYTKEEVIITITTKMKNRRNYTIGGPVWLATVNFSYSDQIRISFFSPLRKSYNIKWDKVKEMTFVYLSA